MGSVRRTGRAPWTNTTVVSVDMFASEAKSDPRAARLRPRTNLLYGCRQPSGYVRRPLRRRAGNSPSGPPVLFTPRFHADYADVGRYFDRVAQALGRESAPPGCNPGCSRVEQM